MSLDTQQTSIPQEKQQETKSKQMDVDNKPKDTGLSQESTNPTPPSRSSSNKSTATQDYNDYVKMLKDKGIDILSPKTHPSFMKTVIKLKKAADDENKKFIEYADKLKSTNMPLNDHFVDLIKSNETNTPERMVFNEFVACNLALLDKKEQENKTLREQIDTMSKKRLPEISEPPKKKFKSNDYHSTDDSQNNNNNISTFIPYGDKSTIQNTRSADMFLQQLLNKKGYFPQFDNMSHSYHESIINGAFHSGTAPLDQIDISGR